MKYFKLIIIVGIFSLYSCSDSAKTELEKEYDIIKKSQPQVVEKPAPSSVEPTYKLGEDYELLDKPYATENDTQVVVYEFFGYTCPHCFYFEPFLEKWLDEKAGFVKLERVPLNFQPSWEVLQQAYLTARNLGVADKAHKKLFESIHNEHKRYNSIDDLAQWYADNFEVNKEAFLSTAESFVLDSQMRKADKMGFLMKVTGTPTVVVNGKYKISKKVRNRDEIIKILKFLNKKSAKEMGLIAE